MSERPSAEEQPRFWIGELLATLSGIYAAALLLLPVAVSEQTLAKVNLSVPLCLGGAAVLVVLCVLLAWQAAADRQARQSTAEERSHLDV